MNVLVISHMYPSSFDENNGINAISEEFNWKKEEKKLIYISF